MRAINANALALLARMEAGEMIPMVQLIELSMTVPLYITNAGRELEWGGNTYLPVGIAVDQIEGSVDEVSGVTLVLPGVTEQQLALALTEQTEGKAVAIYDAILDPTTGVVEDAVLAWAGTMSMPTIEDGDIASINIACEHSGATAVRPKPSRYTNDEQQRRYPGDTSLDFDPATDAAPLTWPAASFWRLP